jgi:hypothetical protein
MTSNMASASHSKKEFCDRTLKFGFVQTKQWISSGLSNVYSKRPTLTKSSLRNLNIFKKSR